MSTVLPDPDELRKEAKKAQAAAKREATRKAKLEAARKAERIAAIQKGKLEELMRMTTEQMKADAKQGRLGSRVHLASVEQYPPQHYYEAMEPIWAALVEHFADKYAAKLDYDYHTRYEGLMDPSPVPDGEDVYLVVSWADR